MVLWGRRGFPSPSTRSSAEEKQQHWALSSSWGSQAKHVSREKVTEGAAARGILGRCTGCIARWLHSCVACVTIALPHDGRNATHARQGPYILFLSLLCTRAIDHFLLSAVNRRSSQPRFKGTQCTQAQRRLARGSTLWALCRFYTSQSVPGESEAEAAGSAVRTTKI